MRLTLSPALQKALTVAAEEAALRRHVHVGLDHLFYIFLRDGALTALLKTCECDAAELERELAEYLDLLPERPAKSKKLPQPDKTFHLVLERTLRHALGAGKAQVEAHDVLVQLLGEKEVYTALLLHAEGLSRLTLLRCIAHGSARPRVLTDEALGHAARAQLVLLNDDYTPMDFVVTVLRDIFRCSDEEAITLMLRVHQNGHAVVGKYPLPLAREKARAVLECAAQAEFPLLCTLEPVGL